MDSSVALVSAAFSKPEDESTWTPMDRALSAFTVAIERSSVAGVTDAMKRIKGPITQSLFSPRSALQKTAILLLVGAAKFLQGLFATQGFASEHLPSLLMLCAKASVVMVRLASTAIEDIVTACSSASSPAALLPFASVCLAELRKGAKVSKPLRIVAVDSVKCVVEGLRNNDADGYRLLEVVQEVIRLAISDSASEVRDSGRHLFTEYAQLYSEDRIQKFATTLSPQHIKSLNIKPPTQQPRNATEINRAKVQFGESKQQEFQRLQLKKVEAIATQDLATNHLSLPTSAIDISRLAFIQSDSGRRVMPRKSIDDNLYNSFQPESSLDFETPPNFVDDFDGESILAGVSEGVLGAIEYCIGLPETEEQTVDVTQDIEENHDSEIQKLLAEIEQIENQRNVSPESEPETNKEVVLSEPISSSNQVEEELVVVVVTPSPQSESDEPDEIVVIRASNGSISPAATPTPSMDEISGDIVTTLDVKYTMTLGEEVAAAEASKSYSAPIDMVDDVSVELDPDFAFDGDSPVEVITPDSVVEAPRPDSSIETLLDSPDAESQGIFVVENDEAVIPESHEKDEVAATVTDIDGDADTIGENASPISFELRGFSEEKVDESNVVQFQALSSAGVVETLTVTVVDDVEPSDVAVTAEGPSTVKDTNDTLTMRKNEKSLSETTVEVSVDSDSQHDGSSVRSISPIPPRSSIMSPEPTLSSSHKNRLSHLPMSRTSSLRGSSSTNSISAEMQNVRKHQTIASLPMSQSVPNLMRSPSLQRQTSLPRSHTISSASQLQVPRQDQPSMLRQPTLTRSPSSSPQQIPKPNRFSPSPTSSPPNSPLVPLRRQQSIMSVSPTPKATVTRATSSNFSPSKLVSASQRSDSASSGDGLRKVMSFANAPSPTPRKAGVTSPTPTPGTLRRINAKVDTGLGSRAPSLRVLSPPPSPTPSSQSMKRISVASSSSSTGSFRNVVHWDASSSETGSNRKSVRWSEDLAVVLGRRDCWRCRDSVAVFGR
ncbi:hypothetical protein BCR33DRAFT_348646 [Rhizoclosmatium globosum]|uniref:CLASP N-terminal domain-containing protein n=1 Tax=Rhizoclosmatium globosum TaxID=329046 RepID=A0A1Y2C1M3_9FUNG|nr:hypothetical protein BCR33DRAFT_348646 [Rhizoclosmatium globosum]|eukprot:ORY40928.1 hypothetical protein BCR33DRAFT_348646 [Rhizoclosmatium globosum]